jgi:hypothetical protein
MAANGNIFDAPELEDFLERPQREREALHYQVSRVAASRVLDLHTDLGVLVAALARHTAATDRNTAAIETAFAGVIQQKRPRSVPPPRDKLPSILDEKENDSTAIRELKSRVAPLLQQREDELAVQAADARRLKTLATGLSLFIAGAAVAGIIWAIFKYAVHQV